MVRDIDRAEELAQDALVVALAEWPRTGVPANPGAWLMAVAKRRAIDALRRDKMRERKHEEIARTSSGQQRPRDAAEAIEAAIDDDLGDELLGLIFTACHPMLSPDARAALTLRVVGGLTTDEIARAFLSSEADDRPAHRPREEGDRTGRIDLRGAARRRTGGAAALGARGHLPDLQRRLCGHGGRRPGPAGPGLEAQRLGRMLAGLMPEDAEVLGLLALMEIQASRLGARTGPDGAFIPLTEQDRARWDQLLIRRGLDALARAEALGGRRRPLCAASRARRLPRPRATGRRYRLAAHRRALRPAARRGALAGGRSQSRDRPQHGLRARSGPATGGRDRRRRRAAPLRALAGGARRLSVPRRPAGRGASNSRLRPRSPATRAKGHFSSHGRTPATPTTESCF